MAEHLKIMNKRMVLLNPVSPICNVIHSQKFMEKTAKSVSPDKDRGQSTLTADDDGQHINETSPEQDIRGDSPNGIAIENR